MFFKTKKDALEKSNAGDLVFVGYPKMLTAYRVSLSNEQKSLNFVYHVPDNNKYVYAVIIKSYNVEYGCDEYSVPIEIFSSYEKAKIFRDNTSLNAEYEEFIIEPYLVK